MTPASRGIAAADVYAAAVALVAAAVAVGFSLRARRSLS